jgi:hypothetical protein
MNEEEEFMRVMTSSHSLNVELNEIIPTAGEPSVNVTNLFNC